MLKVEGVFQLQKIFNHIAQGPWGDNFGPGPPRKRTCRYFMISKISDGKDVSRLALRSSLVTVANIGSELKPGEREPIFRLRSSSQACIGFPAIFHLADPSGPWLPNLWKPLHLER